MRQNRIMVIDQDTDNMIGALQSALSTLATKPSKLAVVRAAVAHARKHILEAEQVVSKVPRASASVSVRVDNETTARILEIQDALSVKVKRKWHLRRGGTITAGRPNKSEVIKDAVTALLEQHGG